MMRKLGVFQECFARNVKSCGPKSIATPTGTPPMRSLDFDCDYRLHAPNFSNAADARDINGFSSYWDGMVPQEPQAMLYQTLAGPGWSESRLLRIRTGDR